MEHHRQRNRSKTHLLGIKSLMLCRVVVLHQLGDSLARVIIKFMSFLSQTFGFRLLWENTKNKLLAKMRDIS